MNVSLPSLEWRREGRIFAWLLAAFLLAWLLPVESERFEKAAIEGFALLQWYTEEHVVLCLLPAFVIAGAIAVFVNQDAVMRFLGPSAPKATAMSVASVSGSVLAVCSCTVLPLFGGIYRRGAGLGPAIAFLYSGPAINILAVILTARVLGLELGIARAVGAVGFAFLIGLLMHFFFLREERERTGSAKGFVAAGSDTGLSTFDSVMLFALLIGVLVFANWAQVPGDGTFHLIGLWKWSITAFFAAILALFLVLKRHWSPIGMALTSAVVLALALALPSHPEAAFAAGLTGLLVQAMMRPGDGHPWFEQSWDFAKKILPLLLLGVLAAGFFLGRPSQEGIIPTTWVTTTVGGNGLGATFAASLIGGLMYFATLTEIPIVQGLIGAGMGKGPALALLLAGPAVSLPNLLAIRALIGTKKTLVYVTLVVIMATITGLIYGHWF